MGGWEWLQCFYSACKRDELFYYSFCTEGLAVTPAALLDVELASAKTSFSVVSLCAMCGRLLPLNKAKDLVNNKFVVW